MSAVDNESGVLAAWVEGLESRNLPRLLEIKSELEGGRHLTDFDVNFMSEMMQDAQQLEAAFARHPQYLSLAKRVFDLCHEIAQTALAREMDGAK